MNCDKCKEAIRSGEPVVYYGETLCQDCYQDVKSSPGCCSHGKEASEKGHKGSCCGHMETEVEGDSCCSGHEHHHGGCCAGPRGRGSK
jgi:hypothetical protein